jgi:acyl carrier protein
MEGGTSISNSDLTYRILRIIARIPNVPLANGELDDDTDLYEAGLKSLAAVHLMLALEEEFGIEFPDSVLHRSAFATVGRIRALIESLMLSAVRL